MHQLVGELVDLNFHTFCLRPRRPQGASVRLFSPGRTLLTLICLYSVVVF